MPARAPSRISFRTTWLTWNLRGNLWRRKFAGCFPRRSRALSAEELRTFYNGIDQVDSVGVMIATLLRFCIATGGQRPEQILRVPWSDYDMDNRTFRIEDRKGRAGVRIHLVPLTDRALGLLEEVRPISGGYEWPFSFNGAAPLHPASVTTAVSRFIASDQAWVRGEPMQTFHPREFEYFE